MERKIISVEITIVIEPEGHGYTARTASNRWSGFGFTPEEAIESLKRNMIAYPA